MATLYRIHYSPWSQKAMWALEHHDTPHRQVEYLPMLGAPLMRLRTRTLRGRITMPLWVDGRTVLRDSFDIALYADASGDPRRTLFGNRRAEIAAWNQASENALEAARALAVQRFARDPEALADSVPGPRIAVLAPLLTGVGRLGARYLRTKYDTDHFDEAHALGTITDTLDALEEVLGDEPVSAAGEPAYVLGERFSYADITLSLVLQIVEPADESYIRLKPSARRNWRTPELAARYAPLVAWRDALFAKHRRRRPR